MTAPAPTTSPAATRRALGLRWWRELVYIGAFYGIYTLVRNTQGSARVGAVHAFHNARDIIQVERWLAIYHEETIQDWFLREGLWRRFIQFWDVFYGSAHFIVTAFALIWLFRRMPQRYALWRNTLALATGFALVGFALFPLMPPRLLPSSYGYVDTLRVVGGLWNFDSGAMAKVSNQYAAMPSLHCAWATWVVFVLWPWAGGSRIRKIVLVGHPVATVFCIVVTANHYFLDAAGGLLTLAVGFVAARALTNALDARRGSGAGLSAGARS